MSHPEAARLLVPPWPGLRPGDLLGSYQVLEPVAEGGMACVYAAQHVKLQRQVALKVLKPGLAVRAREVRRFLEEARAISALRHPRIVEIHDFVEHAEADPPLFYMVMELLQGCTLSAHLHRTGPLAGNEAIKIGCQVAEGLAAVHRAGLLHRDLKASNIFLVESQDPPAAKLLDFGLTVPLGPQQGEGDPAGKILGTPEYMSPEQIQGHELDVRSDIYALGVVLYEMLAGERPFVGPSLAAILAGHTGELPPRLRQRRPMSEELEAVVLRCLEKEPRRRYPDVQALRAALASCLTTTSEAEPDIVIGPPLRSYRRVLLLTGVLLVGAAGAVAGLAYLELQRPDAQPAAVRGAPRTLQTDAAASNRADRTKDSGVAAPLADAAPASETLTTRPAAKKVRTVRRGKRGGPEGGLTVDPWKL